MLNGDSIEQLEALDDAKFCASHSAVGLFNNCKPAQSIQRV